ncbi:unnamed protein product, partial [Effrenium voratum]
MGPAGLERCDVPAVEGKGLAWPQLRRHAAGVVLTGLFAEHELLPWRQEAVLARHGNETFYADNTRGNYAHPKLEEYVRRQNGERMIFVSDTLQGAFGAAWRFASGSKGSARRKLLRDFAERPIFSVGVAGSGVPSHDGHPETWHALLSGVKAWWLGPSGASKIPSFRGWEDPCGAAFGTLQGDSSVPEGVKLCIQRAGEVLYFGEGVEHSTCSLSNFSLAVGPHGTLARAAAGRQPGRPENRAAPTEAVACGACRTTALAGRYGREVRPLRAAPCGAARLCGGGGGAAGRPSRPNTSGQRGLASWRPSVAMPRSWSNSG